MARHVAQLDAWIKANLVPKIAPWAQLQKAMLDAVPAPPVRCDEHGRLPHDTTATWIPTSSTRRTHPDTTTPLVSADAQVTKVVRDEMAYNADEAAVERLLESEPAARVWLRLV